MQCFSLMFLWLLTEILLTSPHQDFWRIHCTNDTALGLSGVKNHCSRHPALKKGPSLIFIKGIPSDVIWVGLDFKLKYDIKISTSPFPPPATCIMVFKTNSFGFLLLREMVLEVTECYWSHNNPLSLLSAWLFSTERWRNQERLEHLVSLVAVLEEEQVQVFICFCHYQVVLSLRVGISGFSPNDSVELLQPYSWLT